MRRRQLIGTAALTDLSPLCWASSSMDHFQLIIVGAGAAGLTCACIAAENGAKISLS
ncbi:FAD-binding protein [Turicimonas muris]|uniref:FAD-binding protein n=1 Tax=Turicimonas muris TaxID=1796652 RepID=UPI00248B0DBE|nr:FAD-binding protein [Turicimonas muris]